MMTTSLTGLNDLLNTKQISQYRRWSSSVETAIIHSNKNRKTTELDEMLPLMVNVLPTTMSGASPAPAAPQAIPTNLLNDASAASRQQLPVAVAATGAPAAFSPHTPPSKPKIRVATNAATTPLAAQFLAQTPNATSEDLAIFTVPQQRPRPPVTEDNVPDDLEDMHPTAERTAPPFISMIHTLPQMGHARGASAYSIAVARNFTLTYPATIRETM